MLLSTNICGFNLESKLRNLISRVHFFNVTVIPGKSIYTSISISLNVKYIKQFLAYLTNRAIEKIKYDNIYKNVFRSIRGMAS